MLEVRIDAPGTKDVAQKVGRINKGVRGLAGKMAALAATMEKFVREMRKQSLQGRGK